MRATLAFAGMARSYNGSVGGRHAGDPGFREQSSLLQIGLLWLWGQVAHQ